MSATGQETSAYKSPYLTADHPDAHVDHPTPADRLEQWRKYHQKTPNPSVCPKCNGYGGHNLQVNQYPLRAGMEDTAETRHTYCHFRASCMQCTGWGYVVDPRDAACAHEFDRGRNVGRCLTNYTCTKPQCGRVYTIDSSD